MEITLNPEDNLRLANLCGALDENIKQIEDALDIDITRRGAHFKLTGDLHHTRLAAQMHDALVRDVGDPQRRHCNVQLHACGPALDGDARFSGSAHHDLQARLADTAQDTRDPLRVRYF